MDQYTNLTPDRELDWGDEINQDAREIILLPEGDYPFQVVNLEKARHTPREGSKIPPCNKAILTLRVTAPEGLQTDLRLNLYLHTSQEWKLGEFFCGIGQKRKGEPLRMNWAAVIGSRGRCHVKQRPWKDTMVNEIARILPAEEVPAQATWQGGYQQPQGYQQQTMAYPQSGYTPGKF